jgi:hypothetical protein
MIYGTPIGSKKVKIAVPEFKLRDKSGRLSDLRNGMVNGGK